MQYQESVSSHNWVCFPLQLSMNERHSFSLSFCLGEVSKYTNQIFGRIVERASNISSRISKLRQRVLDLEEKYPEIENKISATQDVSTLFNQDIGMQTVPPSIDDLEPSVTTKDENLSLQSLPRSEYIQSLYNKTRPDPDFNTLESAAGQDVCHFLLISSIVEFTTILFQSCCHQGACTSSSRSFTVLDQRKEEEGEEDSAFSAEAVVYHLLLKEFLSSFQFFSSESFCQRLLLCVSSSHGYISLPLSHSLDNPFEANLMGEDQADDVSFDALFNEGEEKPAAPSAQPPSSSFSEEPQTSTTQSEEPPAVSRPPPAGGRNDLLSAIQSFDRSKLRKTQPPPSEEETPSAGPAAAPAPARPAGGMPNDLFAQIRAFDRSKLRSVKEETASASASVSAPPASNPQQDLLAAIKNFNRANLKPVSREEQKSAPVANNPQNALLSQIVNFDRSKLNKVNIEEEREKRKNEAPVNPMNNMLKEIMARRFALLNTQNDSDSESEDSEWSD